MSADNGIYIGRFNDGEYRVIHAQAIDSLYYPDGENAVYIVDYFRDAPVFDTLDAAQKEAFRMENEITQDSIYPILEYGISILGFSKSFQEYVKQSEEQKKREIYFEE